LPPCSMSTAPFLDPCPEEFNALSPCFIGSSLNHINTESMLISAYNNSIRFSNSCMCKPRWQNCLTLLQNSNKILKVLALTCFPLKRHGNRGKLEKQWNDKTLNTSLNLIQWSDEAFNAGLI
jgi:hypothetical protein